MPGRCTLRLAAVLVALALVSAIGCARPGPRPTVVDGRMDLSRWDFDAGGDVALLGTWAICWGELLEPGDPCASGWKSVRVRGLWNEAGMDSPFGGRGVATYRLQVDLPAESGRLAINAGGPLTASRIWIDGHERGRDGIVARSAEESKAGVQNRVYDLPSDATAVDVLVQVANFEFRSGGIRRIWYIGRSEAIQAGVGRAILREGMMFAVGVVVGLAYLALFAFGPSERARGYFGLVALVLGLRAIPASISSFGALMAPWMTWDFTVRAEYLGTAIVIFAGSGYALTKVPGVVPPRTMKAIQLVALALAAIVTFAPMPIVLATISLQYALPVLAMGLFITGYGRAWLRGVPGTGTTAAASIVYLGVVVHDIVRTLQSGIGAPVELYPYAIVLWILVEAYELMRLFYRTFEQVESLSDELTEANFELQETEAAIVRFVPFDFLRLLGKQSIRDVHAGDHARSRMTVLHCGFHSSSMVLDRTTTEDDFELVNDFAGRLEELIYHRGGFVNEFHGDGFQAFFQGDGKDAIEAAFEILEVASRRRLGGDVGIGIDTGDVLLGTIGSGDHLLRSVVGEAVERARRIEALTSGRAAKVLISSATRGGLGETHGLEFTPVDDAVVDGHAGQARVFEVRKARAATD